MNIKELLNYIEASQIVNITRHATNEPIYLGIKDDMPPGILNRLALWSISADYRPALGKDVVTIIVESADDMLSIRKRILQKGTYELAETVNGIDIFHSLRARAEPYSIFFGKKGRTFKTLKHAETYCNKQ